MKIMTTFTAVVVLALVCCVMGAKDINQLEKEFWDAWGDTGKAKWGDLLQWTKEYRFHYCAEFHKKAYGEKIPELLYIPSSFPFTISVSFHSEISKQLGLYGRQIYNVETIHCNFVNLIYKNLEEKIANEIDYLITKKKGRNCLLQIYQECLKHKNYKGEGPEYFKIPTDRYYLADEICWEKEPLNKASRDEVEDFGHHLHKISERLSQEIESGNEDVNYDKDGPFTSDEDILRVGQVVVVDDEGVEKKNELVVVEEGKEDLAREPSFAGSGPVTWSEVGRRVQRMMAEEREEEQRVKEEKEKEDHLLDPQSAKSAHLSCSELERRVKRMTAEERGQEAHLQDPQSTQSGYSRCDEVMRKVSRMGGEEKEDVQDPQLTSSGHSSCSEVIRQLRKTADEEEVEDYSLDLQSARSGHLNWDEGVRQLKEMVEVEGEEGNDTQDAQEMDIEPEEPTVDKDNKNEDEAENDEEEEQTQVKHPDGGKLGIDENIIAHGEEEEEKEEIRNSNAEDKAGDNDIKEYAEEMKNQLKEFMTEEIKGVTEGPDGKKIVEILDHPIVDISTAYNSSSSDTECKLSQEILHEEADEIIGLSEEDITTDESMASHILNMTEEEMSTDGSIRSTASPIRNLSYDENLYITEATIYDLSTDWELESQADKIACWSSDDESYYSRIESKEEKDGLYYNDINKA